MGVYLRQTPNLELPSLADLFREEWDDAEKPGKKIICLHSSVDHALGARVVELANFLEPFAASARKEKPVLLVSFKYHEDRYVKDKEYVEKLAAYTSTDLNIYIVVDEKVLAHARKFLDVPAQQPDASEVGNTVRFPRLPDRHLPLYRIRLSHGRSAAKL